jgi:hypothetical protein
MNLRGKVQDGLHNIKQIEGQIVDKIEAGSKSPDDFMSVAYYSGVLNGYLFMKTVFDHMDTMTEKKFDELFANMMHFEKISVN